MNETAKLIIEAIILLVLLALSFFFSSAETALTTVNRIRLMTIAQDDESILQKKAKLVLKIISDRQKMLTAILIGNNIVNLSASSLATMLAVGLVGSYGAGIATGILTFLILILSDPDPRRDHTEEPCDDPLASALPPIRKDNMDSYDHPHPLRLLLYKDF